MIQLVQQLPALYGKCSFITVSTTPTNILLLHSVRNSVRLLLQLTALSSLTRAVRHLLPDPLPYHRLSARTSGRVALYSDTSANEDNSFRNHIRWPKRDFP